MHGGDVGNLSNNGDSSADVGNLINNRDNSGDEVTFPVIETTDKVFFKLLW